MGGSKSSSGGLLLESPREQPKFAEGEEAFSVEKMTYLHYLQVECGVSTEKTPMVLALTHLWWLGSEPNEKQIPSTRTIDASFEQVIAAEDHLLTRNGISAWKCRAKERSNQPLHCQH